MQLKVTTDGERVAPYSGVKAKCPDCGGNVTAHCSSIYADQWAHDLKVDCDSWTYEPITQWHLNWQKYFDLNQSKVTIKRNGQYHTADIVTDNVMILEIQNSSFSAEDIIKRESFYSEKTNG